VAELEQGKCDPPLRTVRELNPRRIKLEDDSDTPGWHDRPTCAGKWVCAFVDGKTRWAVIDIDDSELLSHEMFGRDRRYFGPIPEDKQ